MKLLLCQYNNYYNRIVKRDNTYVFGKYKIIPNINFKENDNVTTQQVINWNEDWDPDYMVLVEDNVEIPIPVINIPRIYEFTVDGDEVDNPEQYTHITDSEWSLDIGPAIRKYDPEYMGNYSLDLELNIAVGQINMGVGVPTGWCDITGDGPTLHVGDFNIIDADYLISKGWSATDVVSDIVFTGSDADAVGGIYSYKPELNFDFVSRWFIMDSTLNRKGQRVLNLRRDIIADDYDNVRDSICNIDRCVLDNTNPLIYNKEPFEFNKIKKDEIPLYDQTGCPWIVGYLPNNFEGLSRSFSWTSDPYDIDMSDKESGQWSLYPYLGTNYGNAKIQKHTLWFGYARPWYIGGYGGGPITVNRYGSTSAGYDHGNIGLDNENIRVSSSKYTDLRSTSMSNWYSWTSLDDTLTTEKGYLTSSQASNILAYAGKKILFSDGIYQITAYRNGTYTFNVGSYVETKDSGTNSYDTGTTSQLICSTASSKCDGTIKHKGAVYTYTAEQFYLGMTKIASAGQISYSIPSTSVELNDAPYKMFAIPYPVESKYSTNVSINGTDIDPNVMFRIASDIVKNTITGSGSSNLYDLQILPYCPIEFNSTIRWDGKHILTTKTGLTENIDYSVITRDSATKGYIFFPSESTFKFTVGKYLNTPLSSKIPLTDVKLQNETQTIRLCASNYSSMFEFNLAKNGGLSSVNVYCTYKPYNPFIQVSPSFGNLYGRDYEDARGLICEGDYSYPIVNDAWVNYELNNKTYQQAFNRELQHLDVSQSIAKQQAKFQAVAGGVQGTVSGLAAGAMTGNPYVAAAGAVIGGVTSTAGGIADYNNLQKQQSEDLNYSVAMFNYSLQNVQALPTGLSKTSSINANAKYVPFIEVYDCTNEEKQILKDFITYQGMTAGYVGKITTTGYVKANLLRYNGDKEPHEIGQINNELLKGVYFE